MTRSADSSTQPRPWLIQGGMGIAISGWTLARAVSQAGQLGVVSGTGIETVFVRRLQDHGVDAGLQSVLDRFPLPAVVEGVLAKYASSRRVGPDAPYRVAPMSTHRNVQVAQDLLVLASYVEVALAKAGHDGIVGMNLLTKVQIPTVPTLFGAMLAGVDYVVMGAGIPVHIPGILDQLALGEPVETALEMVGNVSSDQVPMLRFDPSRFLSGAALRRPDFLGIVSSHVLASALIKRSSGTVNGLVVEAPIAGGHNAPPRGTLSVDQEGNPIYGERDRVDFAVLRELGVPFWIAGGITTPERVREAIDLGACGVQVGTLFAYCRESGLEPGLRDAVLCAVRSESVHVTTSTSASSTGYPFKVASIEGTLSEDDVYNDRVRVCDLGYLREAYLKDDGSVGYRCPSEPIEVFVTKGGAVEDTVDRVCLCNALMATAGYGQIRSKGLRELPIVTSGDCTNELAVLLRDRSDYGASDVIAFLREGLHASVGLADEPATASSGVDD
jgi:nitronate monooxygenase